MSANPIPALIAAEILNKEKECKDKTDNENKLDKKSKIEHDANMKGLSKEYALLQLELDKLKADCEK